MPQAPKRKLNASERIELLEKSQESCLCGPNESQDIVRRYHRELAFLYAHVSHFRNQTQLFKCPKNPMIAFTYKLVVSQRVIKASESVSVDSELMKTINGNKHSFPN